MIKYEMNLRAGYADTDQMGFVHHSNYAKYYETARWELFRSIGISYYSIEKRGVLLPVISMKFQFYQPAHYDEKLRIITVLKEIKGVRILFSYKVYNEAGILINEAETLLAFVKKETQKPCPPPEFVLNKIKSLVRDIEAIA